MKIKLILTGKTTEKHIKEGMRLYEKRLSHYIPLEIIEIPELKGSVNYSNDLVKEKEALQQLKIIREGDYVVLLDEKGKEFRSVELASFMQQRMNTGIKTLVFVVGGPFGFAEELHKRADNKISLSRLTFSHQIVRLLFMEQLYRSYTILRNEPYHHEG